MSDKEIRSDELTTEKCFTLEEVLAERDRILFESAELDDYGGSKKFESEEWEKFKDKLIEEKHRFKKIYETERGSVYFIFDDGKSFRISHKEGEWKNEYVCDYVFFVTQETADKLIKDRNEGDPWLTMNGETYMNREIEIQDLAEGLVPFEFGVSGWQRIDINLDKSKLVIKGDKYGHFSSGAHFGHKITKIIK